MMEIYVYKKFIVSVILCSLDDYEEFTRNFEKYSLLGPFSPDYVGQGVPRSLTDNPALGVVDGISFVKQFLNFRPDYNI